MTQKSLSKCIARRVYELKTHRRNRSLRRIALALSAKDPVWWINNWVWTYDPRLLADHGVAMIPFELFPKQEEFIRFLEEREAKHENGLGEKSRDMGFTWLCAAYLVHHWLFKPGFKGAVGSRKESLVDTIGDPDSIFEKIRMILRNLPEWMLPKGFVWKKHDCFCKLINPSNSATITGEGGDEIGRGGRNTLYFVDEFAFIKHADLVERALSANTDCCIYISTPNGNGNLFARKRESGNIPVFTMHWKDDPRRNYWELIRKSDGELLNYGMGGSPPLEDIPNHCEIRYPWYEQLKKQYDPITIAQEYDIDYTASLEGIAIPARWVRAAVNLHKRIKMPRSERKVAGFDVADGGTAKSVVVIGSGPVIESVHSRQQGGTTDTANWAVRICRENGVRTLNYDPVGVGAGIAGTFRTRAREGTLGLVTNAVNVGVSPTELKWPDGRTSKEAFTNLKAEVWHIVRRRFEKTWEYVEQEVPYPIDELISIPDEPELIRQLSNVLRFETESGKIRMETKDELKKRGVASPDFAEAVMLRFTPVKRSVTAAAGGERKEVTGYKPR